MLLLAATEYAHHRLTSQRRSSPQPSPQLPALPTTQNPDQTSNLLIGGVRYQLLIALRGLAGGEPMLVKTPSPDEAALRLPTRPGELTGWDILFVPGTCHANIIGRLLISAGCCAPSRESHWVPNLAVFQLTELGYACYLKFQLWWSALPWLERMKIMMHE